MKKSILFAAAVALGTTASAQLNFGANVGYGFGLPGSSLGTSTTTQLNGDFTTEAINGSIGSGINAGLNVGYMFNEHFGADLGLDYLIGSNVTVNETSTETALQTIKTEATAKTSQFRISPSLIVTTGGDGLQIYGRAGLVLPVYGSTESQFTSDVLGAQVDQRTTTTGAFALGYQGAIGVAYPLGDKLSLFGELNGINLRIKNKSSEVTTNSVAGVDGIPFMNTSQINTNFVDEISTSSNTMSNPNFDSGKATDALSTTADFSALFIKVGVKFSL